MSVTAIALKKSIDSRTTHVAPIIYDIPFTGISAMPTVKKRAIPRYKALMYEFIAAPVVMHHASACRQLETQITFAKTTP